MCRVTTHLLYTLYIHEVKRYLQPHKLQIQCSPHADPDVDLPEPRRPTQAPLLTSSSVTKCSPKNLVLATYDYGDILTGYYTENELINDNMTV